MSRSSLGYSAMRSNLGMHQFPLPNNPKNLQSSVSNTIKMNPSEEISFLSVTDKILDPHFRATFKNKYKGEMKNGKKFGYGEYMFQNGDFYAGNWQNDHPLGQGIYIFDSNGKNDKQMSAYIGNFEKGFFSGFGKIFTFISPKQGFYVYQGHWRNGRRQGFGKEFYNQDENHFYVGQWYNDERNSERSNLLFPNGQYQGGWENGKMHGTGRMTIHENDQKIVVSGEWMNDQIKYGKISYLKVTDTKEDEFGSYEGEIKDYKREGFGTYKEKNFFYQGYFIQDKPDGNGKMENDHDRYKLEGNFSPQEPTDLQFEISYRNNDKFNGTAEIANKTIKRKEGTYKFTNGDQANGKFVDNVEGDLKGEFAYRWANGIEKRM